MPQEPNNSLPPTLPESAAFVDGTQPQVAPEAVAADVSGEHSVDTATESTPRRTDFTPDRYRVPLPVVRPIPARALVAGVALTAALLSIFGFNVEYGRKELVAGYITPVGGEIRLLAPLAGTVTLHARVGEPLEKGAVVADIQADRQGSLGSVGQSQLDQTQQRIELLENELLLVDSDRQTQLAGLRQQLGQLTVSRERAQAEATARAEVARLTREDLNRRTELSTRGYVSKTDLTQLQLRAASADADAATAARQVADASAQETSLRSAIESTSSKADLTLAEKRRELAALKGTTAEIAADTKTNLLAPSPANITAIAVTTGDTVTAGQLVAKMALNTKAYDVTLQLPESVAGRVHPGLPVFLRLSAYPFETYGQVEAELVSVEKSSLLPDDAAANRTTREPTVKAIAVIKAVPPNVELQPGMSGQAAVEVERRKLLAWMLWPLLKHFLG